MFRRVLPFSSVVCATVTAACWLACASAPAQWPTPPPGYPAAPPPTAPRFPPTVPGFPPTAAVTPPTLPAAPSAAALAAPDIIRRSQGSLVLAEGHEGAGSGFICELGGQKVLLTNAHVMAGNSQVRFTLLDGSPVQVAGADAAVGHDMVRFAVAPTAPALAVVEHANETLLVGDDVLVLGNEKGARVITPISGKVVGLGPDLVEVDAPFQPGNSGSPIIQVKTGRVVGIATFARQERDEEAERAHLPQPSTFDPRTGRTMSNPYYVPPTRLRRFGYRIDNVKTWQPIAWPEFQAEAALLQKVDGLTDDVVALVREINLHEGDLPTSTHYAPAVQRPVQDFLDATSHHPSQSDLQQARQRLLDSLRRACLSDMAEVRPRLRYDYFQRDADETQRRRDELSKMFERALQAQNNRSGR